MLKPEFVRPMTFADGNQEPNRHNQVYAFLEEKGREMFGHFPNQENPQYWNNPISRTLDFVQIWIGSNLYLNVSQRRIPSANIFILTNNDYSTAEQLVRGGMPYQGKTRAFNFGLRTIVAENIPESRWATALRCAHESLHGYSHTQLTVRQSQLAFDQVGYLSFKPDGSVKNFDVNEAVIVGLMQEMFGTEYQTENPTVLALRDAYKEHPERPEDIEKFEQMVTLLCLENQVSEKEAKKQLFRGLFVNPNSVLEKLGLL